MTHNDLRTSESEWRATKHVNPSSRPYKQTPKWSLKASTAMKLCGLLLMAAAVYGLYLTSPAKQFPECIGSDVPAHCVD